MTLGIPVTFQIPGAPARGAGLTLADAVGSGILVAVATFDGSAPAPNNGLIRLPVTFLAPAKLTPQQAGDNMCKALLLREMYMRNGDLANQPIPTTDAQKAAVHAYLAKYGQPVGP